MAKKKEEKEVKQAAATQEAETKDESLLAHACKAFGIDEQFVLGSTVYPDGRVTIVTNGGAKVSWRKGDEVEPLDQIRVDGIIRKKMRPVTGVKKKK